MTAAEVLTRAQSALAVPVRYRLGQPGRIFPPGVEDVPVPPICDCSGFALWCLRMERSVGMLWFNTDTIVRDATRYCKYFEACSPERGCLIVYPSGNGRRYGHIGIVSDVVDGKVSKVIHCAAGNYRRTGSAVQETGPEVFEKNGAITVKKKGTT